MKYKYSDRIYIHSNRDWWLAVKCYNTDENKSRYSGTSATKKHFQGMVPHMGNKKLVFLMPIKLM